jgi:uncharacterized protein
MFQYRVTSLGLAVAMAATSLWWSPPPHASAQEDVTAKVLGRETQTEGARRVLVIGDALSGGLGAGLSRLTEGKGEFLATFRPNEASGLARPEIYDWAASIPGILEAQDYWAVVVMIGVNDRREVGDAEFRSTAWPEEYKKNISRLLDALRNDNVRVFWVSQPPFAQEALNADMQYISAIQKELVEARGETFIDLYSPLIGEDGKFTDMGTDDAGTLRKLRASNGVGFYKEGNNRIAQILLGAIKARAADDAFEKASASAAPETPLIGRADLNGEPALFDTIELSKSLQQTAKVKEQTPQPITSTSTSATRLFTFGDPGEAPKGRFDDFSFVPQP